MITINKQKMMIDDYISIDHVDDTCIMITLDHKKLSIHGKDLCILVLEKQQFVLSGSIHEMKWSHYETIRN